MQNFLLMILNGTFLEVPGNLLPVGIFISHQKPPSVKNFIKKAVEIVVAIHKNRKQRGHILVFFL